MEKKKLGVFRKTSVTHAFKQLLTLLFKENPKHLFGLPMPLTSWKEFQDILVFSLGSDHASIDAYIFGHANNSLGTLHMLEVNYMCFWNTIITRRFLC